MEITRFSSEETTERMILNSLDGTKILSTLNRMRDQENPIGLAIFFPSIITETIVDDTSLRSSLISPN